jgi:hypothetical protein
MVNDDQFSAQYMANIRQIIKKHPAGIAVQGVGAGPDSPGYAYTIGLLERHGFELIVFLLPMQYATMIFNSIARSLKEGVELTPDVPMHDQPWIANWPALFKQCQPELLDDRVGIAQRYHRRADFPVLQLVLCDKSGRFPGTPGYNLPGQPLLYLAAPSDDLRILPMWSVYDHPQDHPNHWVARRWEVGGAGTEPVATSQLFKAETLEALRQMLPPGLHCMPRAPGDDPNIVETWL